MRSIIKYFIERPIIVNLCLFLLVGMGAIQLVRTQTTNFPKQRVRFISIAVPYPGASPTEVESGITVKIEDNLEGIQGIDRVTSTSGENLATVLVEMTEDSKPSAVLAEVKNAVDQINNFPDRAEPPIIEKIEIKDIALTFGVVGDVPLSVKKDYSDQIEDELMAMPEISDIIVSGLPAEEIEIRIRENDLQKYQLSFVQVAQAIRLSNLETYGGEIKTLRQNITVKADSKGYYAKELQNILVKADPSGNLVYLKDVADIVDQFADSPSGRFLGQEPIVAMTVHAIADEDLLENAAIVRNYIDDFNATHSNIQLKVLEDGTVQVRDRLSSMVNNGVVGVILVLIVLALFLDKYLAFWVALKIPIAIIGMFILVPIQDMTINVVSLFGFILVLGILVDDGVVIGENIFQWAKNKGVSPQKAALEGTMEMVTPVLISLTTTGVAFAMFFFLPTQAGEFFGEMGFVVVCVLIVAMIESFFFLPAHLAHSKGLKADNKQSLIERWFDNLLRFLRDNIYLPLYNRFSVGNRWLSAMTVVAFIAIFGLVVSLVPSGKVGFTFFPNLDDDAVFIEMELKPGTPVEITQARLTEIEGAVWQVNEEYNAKREDGKEVVRFVEQITGPRPNEGKLKVTFLGGEQRGITSFELSNRMRELSPQVPEAESLVFGIGATSAVFGKPISFALKSRNLEELRSAKEMLKQKMAQRSDVKDISDSDQTGVQELIIKPTREAELLGLNLGQIMAQVRAGFFGEEVQSLQRGEDEVKIWVRYPRAGRSRTEELLKMNIQDGRGNSYELEDLVELEERIGSLSINRLESQREIRVEANVASIEVSAPVVIGEIEAEYLPGILEAFPSISYSVEGQNRQSFKMTGAIAAIGPVILLFIFALVVLNFNSFSQAALVFTLFPFALIGVILGHYIIGISLNIFSFVGTIALIGVFVNNSLVFISTLNQKLEEGGQWISSLQETASSRFRPILLTTITTVAGLGPLIASNSVGAQFLKGPAIAIAFGLSFGLLNILFLMPAIFHLHNGAKVRIAKLMGNQSATEESVEPAVKALRNRIDEI
ncbi:MAG: efflux RND transporter permease subunit [Bacteroidota bacterium]